MSVRESSKEAYAEMQATGKDYLHRRKIQVYLKLCPQPVTSKELARRMEGVLTYHEIARRLSELREAGIVEEAGRCEKTKFKPILWKIAE